MGIIDESTCIKNHKAKRTKKALEIGQKCKVRRIATGSPITNSPLDLFSQFAFLDKQILGCGSFYAFRNVYAEVERITTRQGQSFDKILKYKNLPMLSRRIEPFSYRITKKECLDLPDKIYTTRDVELTPEQKLLYKQMKDLSFAMCNDEIMSVQVALTKILRLHQILCGSFTTDEGEVKQIPNNRLSVLSDTLEEISGKVIIWANYLQNIKDITEMLTEKYGKESFVVYTGATSSDDRVEAINLFQNANSPVRFFVGNVQTAGRGITLTAAQTVIYYSNNYSLEMRQQSEDRAHRHGQTNKVTYIDLIARDTLDEKIIQALLAKRNIANEILHDDLEDWIKL
jgi:SNF2 family DNA or RNA helicase